MEDIYIARQPIYDRGLDLIGYELLYRNNEHNAAVITDADQASSETIVNSFIHIGIDNLVGTALAFVNLPEEFIVNHDLIPMFYEQSVLEILEDVEPTQEVIDGIKSLKSKGYKIALDDFVYHDDLIPMLELADFIKLDVLALNYDELDHTIRSVAPFNVKLIAEKVETQSLFKQCKILGFDYYQGYFFCHPQMVTEKNNAPNKTVALNLIRALQDNETDFDEVESILRQDVALSYKLLRYINSAAFSLRSEIESIKDAIVLLGLDSIKIWVTLILMSRLADNKPRELVVTALVRAKMSERIASQTQPELERQSFICGLFSVLDALMDKPMIDLLDTVILSTPIKMALLDNEGELGQLLKNVICYEQAKFDQLHNENINTDHYYDSYLYAIKWAEETMSAIN